MFSDFVVHHFSRCGGFRPGAVSWRVNTASDLIGVGCRVTPARRSAAHLCCAVGSASDAPPLSTTPLGSPPGLPPQSRTLAVIPVSVPAGDRTASEQRLLNLYVLIEYTYWLENIRYVSKLCEP